MAKSRCLEKNTGTGKHKAVLSLNILSTALFDSGNSWVVSFYLIDLIGWPFHSFTFELLQTISIFRRLWKMVKEWECSPGEQDIQGFRPCWNESLSLPWNSHWVAVSGGWSWHHFFCTNLPPVAPFSATREILESLHEAALCKMCVMRGSLA